VEKIFYALFGGIIGFVLYLLGRGKVVPDKRDGADRIRDEIDREVERDREIKRDIGESRRIVEIIERNTNENREFIGRERERLQADRELIKRIRERGESKD